MFTSSRLDWEQPAQEKWNWLFLLHSSLTHSVRNPKTNITKVFKTHLLSRLLCLTYFNRKIVILNKKAVPNRPAVVPRLLPAAFNSFGRFQQRFLSGDKIVGGSEVVPNSIPFQVLLQRQAIVGYNNVCGGTILDEKTILTAAHCVEGCVMISNLFQVVSIHNKLDGFDIGTIRLSSVLLQENIIWTRRVILSKSEMCPALNFMKTMFMIHRRMTLLFLLWVTR